MTETLTIQEPSEVNKLPKHGYWSTHDYFRLSVTENIEEFVGWTPLLDLFKLIHRPLIKRYFAFLFQTGGRASEVLALKRGNFEILKEEGFIKVSHMLLLKRYEKLDSYLDAEGLNRWHTQKKYKERKIFTISMKEPLTPILVEHLNEVKELGAYLFASPYKHRKKFIKAHAKIEESLFDVNGNLPYVPTWMYRNIRKINDLAPKTLKQRLGLLTPFYANVEGKKEPVKVSDQLHLFLHWFRSQKASQLVDDYQFVIDDLLAYFSWEDWVTANRYAKRSWKGLASKMSKANPSFLR